MLKENCLYGGRAGTRTPDLLRVKRKLQPSTLVFIESSSPCDAAITDQKPPIVPFSVPFRVANSSPIPAGHEGGRTPSVPPSSFSALDVAA